MKIATSYLRETKFPRYQALNKSAAFDVVVVGGGITGLTAAYLLQKAGKSVCVLERDRVAMVDTGHTTAHLTYVTDMRLPVLVKYFGEQRAQLAWAASGATTTRRTSKPTLHQRITNIDGQRSRL